MKPSRSSPTQKKAPKPKTRKKTEVTGANIATATLLLWMQKAPDQEYEIHCTKTTFSIKPKKV